MSKLVHRLGIQASGSGWDGGWTSDSERGIAVLDGPYEGRIQQRTQRRPRQRTPGPVKKDSRVVIVCPYNLLNVYFESEIPRVLEDSEVDILSMADLAEKPWVDVFSRESEKPVPTWILDFQKIVAEDPSSVVDFTGYKDWTGREKSVYLTPVSSFSKELASRHMYEDGVFQSHKVRVADFYPDLSADLRKVRSGARDLKLLVRNE